MDLNRGYWQVDLSKEDREKCALISRKYIFKPTLTPQRLCNTPTTFKRSMENILVDFKIFYVLLYLNYITVFSLTFQDHIAHLNLFLNAYA